MLTLDFKLSNSLSQAGKDDLRKNGVGFLRIALGTIRNKKQFFNTRYREESFKSVTLEEGSLIHKMLDDYWWEVKRIPGGGELLHVHSDALITLEKSQDLGLIIQWSGVRSFEEGKEAVLRMAVADLR